MPPVLPERSPKGAVIEVDEGLVEAVKHRVIFTDTTQHIDDKVRRYLPTPSLSRSRQLLTYRTVK